MNIKIRIKAFIAKILQKIWFNMNIYYKMLLIKKVLSPKTIVRLPIIKKRSVEFLDFIGDRWKYNTLIENLDEESIKTVNEILLTIRKNITSDVLEKKDIIIKKTNEKKIGENKKFIKKQGFKLPIDHYEDSVFLQKHGLDYIPNYVQYTKWKVILDVWWFIWDSAIMFDRFTKPSKIYSFEPITENIHLMKKTIKINNLENIIIPVEEWLWDKIEKQKIDMSYNTSSIIWWKKWKEINMNTIDNFVEQNNIWTIWLIKRDIEWYELESIKWAEKTIKKDKPILLISIYHTGKDFFLIKPLLESRNLWYNFKIRKLSNETNYWMETMLLCYK